MISRASRSSNVLRSAEMSRGLCAKATSNRSADYAALLWSAGVAGGGVDHSGVVTVTPPVPPETEFVTEARACGLEVKVGLEAFAALAPMRQPMTKALGSGGQGGVFQHPDNPSLAWKVSLVGSTANVTQARFEQVLGESLLAVLRDARSIITPHHTWLAIGSPVELLGDTFGRPLGSQQDTMLVVQEMQCVEGSTLGHLCDEVMAPGDRTLLVMGVLQQLSVALHYMHCRNIVHRDLKMPNVMRRADNYQVQLLDFGFSWFSSWCSAASAAPEPPQHGGTLDYYSPERLLNNYLVHAGDDWFALGIVLFQLMCGCSRQLPYLDLPQWLQCQGLPSFEGCMMRAFCMGEASGVRWPVGIKDAYHPVLVGLVEGLLCRDESQRWGYAQVHCVLQAFLGCSLPDPNNDDLFPTPFGPATHRWLLSPSAAATASIPASPGASDVTDASGEGIAASAVSFISPTRPQAHSAAAALQPADFTGLDLNWTLANMQAAASPLAAAGSDAGVVGSPSPAPARGHSSATHSEGFPLSSRGASSRSSWSSAGPCASLLFSVGMFQQLVDMQAAPGSSSSSSWQQGASEEAAEENQGVTEGTCNASGLSRSSSCDRGASCLQQVTSMAVAQEDTEAVAEDSEDVTEEVESEDGCDLPSSSSCDSSRGECLQQPVDSTEQVSVQSDSELFHAAYDAHWFGGKACGMAAPTASAQQAVRPQRCWTLRRLLGCVGL